MARGIGLLQRGGIQLSSAEDHTPNPCQIVLTDQGLPAETAFLFSCLAGTQVIEISAFALDLSVFGGPEALAGSPVRFHFDFTSHFDSPFFLRHKDLFRRYRRL